MPVLNRAVLVVDDEPEMNAIIGSYVEIAGFGYRCALTGTEALKEARRGPLSLILLDIMLPDLSGFQVCQALKGDPTTSSIPVVFVSALSGEEHRRLGKQSGAAEYLNKPFSPDALLNCLQLISRY